MAILNKEQRGFTRLEKLLYPSLVKLNDIQLSDEIMNPNGSDAVIYFNFDTMNFKHIEIYRDGSLDSENLDTEFTRAHQIQIGTIYGRLSNNNVIFRIYDTPSRIEMKLPDDLITKTRTRILELINPESDTARLHYYVFNIQNHFEFGYDDIMKVNSVINSNNRVDLVISAFLNIKPYEFNDRTWLEMIKFVDFVNNKLELPKLTTSDNNIAELEKHMQDVYRFRMAQLKQNILNQRA